MLDLGPAVEHQILERAEATGVTAAQYVEKLLAEHPLITPAVSPHNPVAHVQSLITKWQQEDKTPLAETILHDETLTPSEALFRQWDEEDAQMTDEERHHQEKLWEDFQQGINLERAATGMRSIF